MPAIHHDSCVCGRALPVLIDLGHDVVWSGAWPQDPGDSAILAAAHTQRRILITETLSRRPPKHRAATSQFPISLPLDSSPFSINIKSTV